MLQQMGSLGMCADVLSLRFIVEAPSRRDGVMNHDLIDLPRGMAPSPVDMEWQVCEPQHSDL